MWYSDEKRRIIWKFITFLRKTSRKNILMTEISNTDGLKKVLFWQKFNEILRKKQSYKIFKVVKRKNVFVQNNDKII